MSKDSQHKADRQLLLDNDLKVVTVYQVKTGSGLVLCQYSDERAAITNGALYWRRLVRRIKNISAGRRAGDDGPNRERETND